MKPDDLLDTDDLAALLGVRPSSLRSMRAQPERHRKIDGLPAPLRLISGRPVWARVDIDRWRDATKPRPRTYERLIDAVFPDWPDAEAVAWRESRCQPDAANPTSSARGLFQLLASLHSHRYVAVGCTAADWPDPVCNTLAARHLYDAAGTSPWRTR